MDADFEAAAAAGLKGAEEGAKVGRKARDAAKDGVTADEALAIAGAAAGAAAAALPGPWAPIVAGAAAVLVAIGAGIASLVDSMRPPRGGAPVLDRYALRVVPVTYELRFGKRVPVTRWRVGMMPDETRFAGVPMGRVSLGKWLWIARRIREDGGGSAEIAWLCRAAGLSYDVPELPSRAEAEAAGREVLAFWRSLPFVSPSAKAAAPPPGLLAFLGYRMAGADRVEARRLAGLPAVPTDASYLADLRERMAAELPPAPPANIARAVKLPPAILAKLGPPRLVVKPSALRRIRVDAAALRSAYLGGAAMPYLFGAGVGAALGWGAAAAGAVALGVPAAAGVGAALGLGAAALMGGAS